MTRLVLARFNHETNSFSPVRTPLASFNPKMGAEALAAADGYPAAIGAFHAFARSIDARIEVRDEQQEQQHARGDGGAFALDARTPAVAAQE